MPEQTAGSERRAGQKAGIARAVALISILAFCSFDRCAALNPASLISQYGHSAWRVQDGALSANPTAFAQTHDGYIWVGTEAGLYRFDEVTFAPCNPPPGQISTWKCQH
jgi:hypothetical protein